MCWWEDEGVEAWEYSGPNAQTLIEAQGEFLAETRAFRLRPGGVRAPKKKEARDPGWLPIERTDDLLERAQRARIAEEKLMEEEECRAAQEIADNPEGPFKEYNAAAEALRGQATHFSHHELKAQLRQISSAHDMPWSDAHLELLSRLMKDENFYRHHPIRSTIWMLRYSRPSNYRQRWREVRTGTISFAM